MFCHIPDIQGSEWPIEFQRLWARDWAKTHGPYSSDIYNNYLVFPVHGTTFSGHSTLTTWGNTSRSLLYLFFYAYEAGLGEIYKPESDV